MQQNSPESGLWNIAEYSLGTWRIYFVKEVIIQ